MFLRSRNSYSASAASRNSSASSASSIKTLYVINHLRDVERMLTSIPPVMMALKLTISYLEMTLFWYRVFSKFPFDYSQFDDEQLREVVQHTNS